MHFVIVWCIFSESESVHYFHRFLMYVLPSDIQLSRGFPLNGLTTPHVFACPTLKPNCLTLYVAYLYLLSEVNWEEIVFVLLILSESLFKISLHNMELQLFHYISRLKYQSTILTVTYVSWSYWFRGIYEIEIRRDMQLTPDIIWRRGPGGSMS
jgi:hypothetical protein